MTPTQAMNAATAQDQLTPPPAPSGGPALALSLLAHALLVLALAWGVNWSRTDPMVSFSAEIWSPTVQEAAPAPPPPAPPAPPEPEAPKAAPVPPPPPAVLRQQAEQREADLALEKRRKEEKQKALAEQADKLAKEKAAKEKLAKEKAQKDKLEREKAEKDKTEQARKLKEKEQKERDKAKEEARKEQARKEAAEQDKLRQDQLRRMKAQLASASSASNAASTGTVANATGAPSAQGNAPRSAAPSSSYAGKIVQLIKDNTRYTDPNAGAWSVVVMVRTARDGRITEAKVITTSGNRAFDDAVLRGVQRMEFVPKDVDGRVPDVLLREGLEIKVTL
jgi:colicin import membrane protein